MTDAISLQGRAAIITGGAGAIGSATARLMHARGAKVAIVDIDRERAEKVAAEIGQGASAVWANLEDEASVVAMVGEVAQRFGRIDILHNNAMFLGRGGPRDLDVESMDAALWDRIFSVNVRGAMIASREALPHLVRSGSGAIVNSVSTAGMRGAANFPAYGASKAALIQLTLSIASSHGRKGVRCNAVAPGVTLLPAAKAPLPPGVLELVIAETPLGRVATPDDIAQVVAFLASPAARHVTGQLIAADGGLTMHLPGLNDLPATNPREDDTPAG